MEKHGAIRNSVGLRTARARGIGPDATDARGDGRTVYVKWCDQGNRAGQHFRCIREAAMWSWEEDNHGAKSKNLFVTIVQP